MLRDQEPPVGLVAAVAIGELGYDSELPILDLVGLVAPVIARSQTEQRGMIQPVATRGMCGRIGPGRVVYDAATAIGASGAPVLNVEGKVVAINTALMKGFAGTNFGVPINRALRLLGGSNSGVTTLAQVNSPSQK